MVTGIMWAIDALLFVGLGVYLIGTFSTIRDRPGTDLTRWFALTYYASLTLAVTFGLSAVIALWTFPFPRNYVFGLWDGALTWVYYRVIPRSVDSSYRSWRRRIQP